MKISLIAAMDLNRVIGHQGQLPWHLPAELQYFKAMTLGKPVVMGRRTFESLKKPLPDRLNIVLSHQKDLKIAGCEVLPSLTAAIQALGGVEELMIIGGGQLFLEALPIATQLYLTFVEARVEGDTYFPEWNVQEWEEMRSADYLADAKNIHNFRMVELKRVRK